MARPIKTNADYFPHSANFRNDVKIRAIRTRYGLIGYAVVMCLMEMISDANNLELEWNELNQELISCDIGVELDVLLSVVEYGVKIQFFNVLDGKLTSTILSELLEHLFQKRKRMQQAYKQSVSEAETNRNSQKSEKTNVSETIINSKVKESKVKILSNKNIDNISLQIENAKKKQTAKRKPKQPTPEAVEFSEWFCSTLPEELQSNKTIMQQSGEAYDKLISIDKKPPDEIRRVCEWARNDDFWCNNFQSVAKLRRNNKDGIRFYDYFKIQMTKNNGTHSKNNGNGQSDYAKRLGLTTEKLAESYRKNEWLQ